MDILKDPRLRAYEKVSRYSTVPYYYNETDEKYIYGTAKKLNTDSAYIYYQIQQGDSFDSIALNQYGDAQFYWVIADYNQVNDPFLKLKPGAYIKIPNISTIVFQGDE